MSADLIFRQLFDQGSGTYTYLLADSESRDGIIIDTVYEQHERDLSLIRELDLKLLACIDTHCHADHVTGAWLLKKATGCAILSSRDSGIEGLDRALGEGDRVEFGGLQLRVLETPGHTDGCISLVDSGQRFVFTGDCLMIRGCGRTDFQQGSARKMYNSIHDKLFRLPGDCVVYPAHDYSGRTTSTIAEEKKLNPRIGGEANETDFVGYMENMKLPHPKKLDVAVPANLKAGRPANDKMPLTPDWAPVIHTYAGIEEISPQWVATHADSVHILDVRTRHETEEESARIRGAQLIPIDELRDRLQEVPRDRPVMTVCRSGRRSALAYDILSKAGWDKVANMQGGLLRWYAEGLPVQHET